MERPVSRVEDTFRYNSIHDSRPPEFSHGPRLMAGGRCGARKHSQDHDQRL